MSQAALTNAEMAAKEAEQLKKDRQSDRRAALKRLLKSPMGMTGVIIVFLFFFCALFAEYIAPYDPVALNIKDRLQGPSLSHLAGTDQLGRDIFTRLLYGSQVSAQLAFVGVGFSMVVGMFLGMLSGFGPRWLDNSLLFIFDVIRSFPSIILALALVALTGPSLTMVMVVFIINAIPGFGRVARTQTMALKNTEFIQAEISMGASTLRIIFKHIMPNVIGPLLILAAMDVPVVVTVEAGLSFLGLGILPPTPSWGSILNEGFGLLRNAPWVVIAAGIPLVITTLGFTFLGEALRDIFDPKLGRRH